MTHPVSLVQVGGHASAIEEQRPQECRRVGLDCRTCTSNSAASVAALCAHLNEDQQRNTFFRLYPDPGCSRAAHKFVSSYQAAVLLR